MLQNNRSPKENIINLIQEEVENEVTWCFVKPRILTMLRLLEQMAEAYFNTVFNNDKPGITIYLWVKDNLVYVILVYGPKGKILFQKLRGYSTDTAV